jgi:hypothetical protein
LIILWNLYRIHYLETTRFVWQTIGYKLKNHRIKLYKKCAALGCEEMITNKTWQHYCIDHTIQQALDTGIVTPFVSIPGIKKSRAKTP